MLRWVSSFTSHHTNGGLLWGSLSSLSPNYGNPTTQSATCSKVFPTTATTTTTRLHRDSEEGLATATAAAAARRRKGRQKEGPPSSLSFPHRLLLRSSNTGKRDPSVEWTERETIRQPLSRSSSFMVRRRRRRRIS